MGRQNLGAKPMSLRDLGRSGRHADPSLRRLKKQNPSTALSHQQISAHVFIRVLVHMPVNSLGPIETLGSIGNRGWILCQIFRIRRIGWAPFLRICDPENYLAGSSCTCWVFVQKALHDKVLRGWLGYLGILRNSAWRGSQNASQPSPYAPGPARGERAIPNWRKSLIRRCQSGRRSARDGTATGWRDRRRYAGRV
jgi:hypothetical protein